MPVSWYFEPSQLQRITSGLKIMFNLSPVYSARKSSNHKLSPCHKISPDTNLQKTFKNIKHKVFKELVSSVLPLLKKYIRLGHTGTIITMDHYVNLSIPDLKKSTKKGMDRSNKKKGHKCITANTRAIWQHVAHTTDQLASHSC